MEEVLIKRLCERRKRRVGKEYLADKQAEKVKRSETGMLKVMVKACFFV